MLAAAVLLLSQAGVTIQDRAIELPDLPRSLRAARKDYHRTAPVLARSLTDLEQNLLETYAQLAPYGPSAFAYRLPVTRTVETAFLESMLQDPAHTALESRVYDAWVGWQTELVRQGLDEPGKAGITSRMVLLPALRITLRPEGDVPGPVTWSLLAVDGFDYDAWGFSARAATRLADVHAPFLADAWQPLARRLNECAVRMLDHERSPEARSDPASRILRLQARINVMERFRAALWFCRMTWAHMASQPLPPPLRRLH